MVQEALREAGYASDLHHADEDELTNEDTLNSTR